MARQRAALIIMNFHLKNWLEFWGINLQQTEQLEQQISVSFTTTIVTVSVFSHQILLPYIFTNRPIWASIFYSVSYWPYQIAIKTDDIKCWTIPLPPPLLPSRHSHIFLPGRLGSHWSGLIISSSCRLSTVHSRLSAINWLPWSNHLSSLSVWLFRKRPRSHHQLFV